MAAETGEPTAMEGRIMTDRETARHIRLWCDQCVGLWSWPTDGCGYEQHARFIRHLNQHWTTGTRAEFAAFVDGYADMLEGKEPNTMKTYEGNVVAFEIVGDVEGRKTTTVKLKFERTPDVALGDRCRLTVGEVVEFRRAP